jgi:hypothetical protein
MSHPRCHSLVALGRIVALARARPAFIHRIEPIRSTLPLRVACAIAFNYARMHSLLLSSSQTPHLPPIKRPFYQTPRPSTFFTPPRCQPPRCQRPGMRTSPCWIWARTAIGGRGKLRISIGGRSVRVVRLTTPSAVEERVKARGRGRW